MRKVREVMYLVCSLHSVDIRDLLDEHEFTHGMSFLDPVNLVARDQLYNVRSGHENTSSDYNVLTLEDWHDGCGFSL